MYGLKGYGHGTRWGKPIQEVDKIEHPEYKRGYRDGIARCAYDSVLLLALIAAAWLVGFLAGAEHVRLELEPVAEVETQTQKQ